MTDTKSAPRSGITDEPVDVHGEKTPYDKGREAGDSTRDEGTDSGDVRDKIREDYSDLSDEDKEEYKRGWRDNTG